MSYHAWQLLTTLHFALVTWCTVLICSRKGYSAVVGVWLSIALQAFGFQLAWWLYVMDSLRSDTFLVWMRYLASASLPLLVGFALPRRLTKAMDDRGQLDDSGLAKSVLPRRIRKRFRLRELLILPLFIAMAPIVAPCDFRSPHMWTIGIPKWGIGDGYYTLAADFSSVSGRFIEQTNLYLGSIATLELPVSALAAALLLAPGAMALRMAGQWIFSNWHRLNRDGQSAVLASFFTALVPAVILLVLIGTGVILWYQIPLRRIVMGILAVACIPMGWYIVKRVAMMVRNT